MDRILSNAGWRLAALAAGLAAAGGCLPARAGERERRMTDADEAFFQVDLESSSESPCSPRPPGPSWRGVLIRAPSRAPFGKGVPPGGHGAFATIPICGYTLVEAGGEPGQGIVLTAVNRATGKRYSAPLVTPEEGTVAPEPIRAPVHPSRLQGLASGGHFNTNLLWTLDLPRAPAVYEIQAQLKGYTSNMVTVELYDASPDR